MSLISCFFSSALEITCFLNSIVYQRFFFPLWEVEPHWFSAILNVFLHNVYKDNSQQRPYKKWMKVFKFLMIIQKGLWFFIQTRMFSKYFEVYCFSLIVKKCQELSFINHLEFATELKLQLLSVTIIFTWKLGMLLKVKYFRELQIWEKKQKIMMNMLSVFIRKIFWLATYL